MKRRRPYNNRSADPGPVIVDDPSKPIDEVLFGPRGGTPIAEPPHQEESMPDPAKPDALATTGSTALAIMPPEVAGAFSPEEWAALPPEEQTQALAFFREEQAATTEGLAVTFPRWKFPTSGATRFVLVMEGDDAPEEKELRGVVVFKMPGRVYYEPGKQVAKGTPPLCSSPDGIIPDVAPSPVSQAKVCVQCPLAQWGTGRDGQGNPTRGQACKLRLRVFFLSGDKPIPEYISLPPTAQKPFGQYAISLRQMRIPLIGVETVFGLTKATSREGTEYMGLTLKVGRKLTFVEMKTAREVASAFDAEMRRRGISVDEVADESHAADDAGDGDGRPVVLDAEGKVVPF